MALQQVLQLASGWCSHICRDPAVPAISFMGLQAHSSVSLQDCFEAGAAALVEAQSPQAPPARGCVLKPYCPCRTC